MADVRSPMAFNPIKVLFLQKITARLRKSTLNFQSYQGSIFTRLRLQHILLVIYFQSYQGSIFT